MIKVVLLMCGKNKLTSKAKARDLYTSERFVKSIEYAKYITSENNIFVLSAKYGLLELKAEIEPYDKSIYEMNISERTKWSNTVIGQLKRRYNLNEDMFIFLTDDFYCQDLYTKLTNCELPLKGLDQKNHIDWFNKMLTKKENDK